MSSKGGLGKMKFTRRAFAGASNGIPPAGSKVRHITNPIIPIAGTPVGRKIRHFRAGGQ